jgi:tetratricopeptide (TPR) repeat protein
MMGGPAFAGDPAGYPDNVQEMDLREVAMLPRYCIYTQSFRERVPGGNNPDEIKRWSDIMGAAYNSMHHYCLGLMKTNRATLARTQEYRLFYLRDAIVEFNYVIQRVPQDFVLLPEILTKKGENLIRMGRGALALKELEHAIGMKPDYWPAYAALSDYYKKSGDVAKAREVLGRGLSFAPAATPLRRRLGELK